MEHKTNNSIYTSKTIFKDRFWEVTAVEMAEWKNVVSLA